MCFKKTQRPSPPTWHGWRGDSERQRLKFAPCGRRGVGVALLTVLHASLSQNWWAGKKCKGDRFKSREKSFKCIKGFSNVVKEQLRDNGCFVLNTENIIETKRLGKYIWDRWQLLLMKTIYKWIESKQLSGNIGKAMKRQLKMTKRWFTGKWWYKCPSKIGEFNTCMYLKF